MKALLVYSHVSGRRNISNRLPFIRSKLGNAFSTLDFFCAMSREDAIRAEKRSCGEYDALIVAGGDGSFHNALNAVMPFSHRPILGYLNFGTLGDVGRNFGVTNSVARSLALIAQKHVEALDVGKIVAEDQTRYFAYLAAYGAYSDISYTSPRRRKKKKGRVAYYEKAFSEAFHPHQITYSLEANGKIYEGQSPFFMVMNGKAVAGFPINASSSIVDGKFEAFLTKNGIFNGLLNYLPVKKIMPLSCSSCVFDPHGSDAWCLDGEKGPQGKAQIVIVPAAIQVFSKFLEH